MSVDLETRLIDELTKNPEGISDSQLKRIFNADYLKLVEPIQNLISTNTIRLLEGPDGYIYQLLTGQEKAQKQRLDGLSDLELLVYQLIQNAGNGGIWSRQIKLQTGYHQNVVVKILKKLETRKLVKCFRTIAAKTRKMYILYELEPSTEQTGGAWYTNQEFDLEYIEIVSKYVVKLIAKERSGLVIDEIVDKINQSGISNAMLTKQDVQMLLEKLSFENILEEVVDYHDKNIVKWKPKNAIEDYDVLSECPCGNCPLYYKCQKNGEVSPINCQYINKWYNLQNTTTS
ncbi:hypothetical protein WA158_007400 [Blastocystis sp. Blastoise]